MTNPYLLSEIEKPQQPKQAEVNPYSMQAIESDQRQDLRNTLTDAVRQQPEHVAEAARLAKRYPAPVDALASNLQDVKLQEAVDKYDETLKTSPKLQQYILNKPWETARLHKDIEPLAKVEQGFTAGIKSGWTQADNQAEMADLLYKELIGFQLSEPQARRLAALKSENRVLARQQENESNLGFLGRTNAYGIRQFASSAWTALQGAGYGAAAGAAAGAPIAGVGAVPGAVAGATAGGFTASNAYAYKQEAAFAFDEFRDLRDTSGQPIPVDIARNAAMGVGVVNAVIESTAGLALLKLVPGADRVIGTLGGDAAKTLVRTQVRSVLANPVTRSAMVQALGKVAAGASIEGIEEFFQTLVGAGGREVAQSLSGQDFKPDEIRDDLAEALTAAKEAAVGTLALGSVVGGANYVSLRRRAQREAEYDRAVASAENIRTQLQTVQDIQAKAHSPEVFREVVQTMANQQEDAPKSLWVDGEVLAQLPAEELATLPAEVQEQIAEAAALSGFVEIPIGQVMLAEQGSVLEQTYVEFARETPTSPTLAEAQEAKALLESDLVTEVESAIAQAQDQDTIRASSEVVRKAVLEQLNTAGTVARRYRPSVNDALARVTAALFTTQAQRMNMTPEQLFVDSGFAVRGRGQGPTAGGRVLNADIATLDQGDVTVTDQVDEMTGLPLNTDGTVTLYHHTSTANAEAIKQSGALRSAGEPDVYLTTRDVPDTGYGDTVVKVRVDPAKLQMDDEFPDGRMDFRVNVGRPGGALTDATFNQAAMAKPYGKQVFSGVIEGLGLTEAETNATVLEFMTGQAKDQPQDGVLNQSAAQTETPEFKAWFGDSKVVDADGKPLVVYHSTYADVLEFELGNRRDSQDEPSDAFYFSDTPMNYAPGGEMVEAYLSISNPLDLKSQDGVDAINAAIDSGELDSGITLGQHRGVQLTTGNLWAQIEDMPNANAFMNGVIAWAKDNGYDGLIHGDFLDGEEYTSYAAFNPTQIKSATGNDGSFNPNDANIYKQGPRGTYSPRNFGIVLNENANLSTYFHELSHFYLDFLGRMAEMPGASPEVVEDFNTFLGWAKVTPEQWREWRDFVVANPNKPLPKGMVKVHESLASAGEQYFLEGKAPSLELQPFMRRFARWMESVYRSLQQFIAGNPNKELQLNADIRRFFDRALATDEEIAQAEQAAGMLPDGDATAEAKERLNKRSMGDLKWSVRMRDGFIADLRKQAKEIRDSIRQTVTEEVDAMPAMQAKDALDRLMAASPEYKADLKAWKDAREAELARATEAVKAQLVAAEEAKTNAPLEGLAKGRFLSKNRAEVENKAEAAALEWEKQNPKPRRITPDMTPQMESIADKYGYTSVDQMLADIDVTGSRRELIDGMTEQRMLEDHGDLIDERAIQQAANEAVHNDARARSLATELRTQQEMLGERADTGRTARNGRKITTNILLAAARNFAANVVGRAKILDLGNLAWKHNSAEARAGKRWQQLTSQGKTVEAVKAKQDQVLNNAAAKAAQEAQAEMRKLLDYVNKFDKESVRAKLPASYLDQIDKLRERVDLRVSTTRRDIDKRAALSKWIESQHALGLDPIVPDYLLDDAQLTSYKEMTVDQFREFADTIKNIEHLGRLKSKLLAAKDKREFDIIVAEIVQEIVANKGTPLPVQLEPDGRIKKFFKGAWADHRKLNSLVRQMDGGKDNGPLYRALVRSMNEAGTKENVMLEQATEAMAKIYAPIEKLPGGFSGASVYIPEINASLSRAGRLAIALNWGNSTNRQRVMGGDNWTEAQVEAILATLSTTELEFVNNVWAQLDSYWPEMKAKQERVSGVVEDKVEAEPFELTAADGTIVQMRGGYYPIKYDSDRSLKSQKNEAQEVAADMLRGAILRPSTRRGHLKARVDEVNRPVRKDLSVITQHVNQVVHDLAWHEWLIDATRLLNDPRIAGSIRDYYGAETHRAMTDSMRAIAEGDIAHQTEIDKLLLLMRSNVTRSIMGASLTTALLQPFGLTQSMARIGVVPVLKGAWRWAGEGAQMQNSMKWIGEKSDFMRLRSKTFNRELREISQRVQGKSKFMQVADASLFFLMQKLQMVADVPTWIGAYEKALAGGVDDATAVQLADEAVLGSQGGGNTKDLAGVQRNLPFLTQFYSYFSTTLQLVAEKTALTDFKNPRAVAGWLGDMALLAVIPAILPALITYLLKGGGEDDEPEDWAKRLAEWQASYVLGMFVGLRELPAVWSPFDYQGPPAGKLINDGKRLVQQAGQGEIDDQAVLATIGFLGTALGIPTTQLVRSYKGWLAWDEGDAPPSSILFGPPPKD